MLSKLVALGMGFFLFPDLGAAQNKFIPISTEPSINEYHTSTYRNESGKLCVVFSVMSLTQTLDQKLFQTCATEDFKFGAISKVLPQLHSETYIDNGNVITNGKETLLYFNTYNAQRDETRWGLSRLVNGVFKDATWLATFESLAQQWRAWIYPYVLNDGHVGMSYEIADFVRNRYALRFATSADGRNFGRPSELTLSAQMHRMAQFADNTLAFTFQQGNGEDILAYVMLSHDDGKSFTDPKLLSEFWNIHDPMPFRRLDGDLDIYYLVAHTNRGYYVYRRRLYANATFGPEQRLSDESTDLQKPNPFRLADGKIFLTLSKVDRPGPNQIKSDIVAMILEEE